MSYLLMRISRKGGLRSVFVEVDGIAETQTWRYRLVLLDSRGLFYHRSILLIEILPKSNAQLRLKF